MEGVNIGCLPHGLLSIILFRPSLSSVFFLILHPDDERKGNDGEDASSLQDEMTAEDLLEPDRQETAVSFGRALRVHGGTRHIGGCQISMKLVHPTAFQRAVRESIPAAAMHRFKPGPSGASDLTG